jgi:hypothetical protein
VGGTASGLPSSGPILPAMRAAGTGGHPRKVVMPSGRGRESAAFIEQRGGLDSEGGIVGQRPIGIGSAIAKGQPRPEGILRGAKYPCRAPTIIRAATIDLDLGAQGERPGSSVQGCSNRHRWGHLWGWAASSDGPGSGEWRPAASSATARAWRHRRSSIERRFLQASPHPRARRRPARSGRSIHGYSYIHERGAEQSYVPERGRCCGEATYPWISCPPRPAPSGRAGTINGRRDHGCDPELLRSIHQAASADAGAMMSPPPPPRLTRIAEQARRASRMRRMVARAASGSWRHSTASNRRRDGGRRLVLG